MHGLTGDRRRKPLHPHPVGSTEVDKKKKIISGEHVAFHFEYRLSKFDDVEAVEIPRGAQRLLAKR